MRDRTIVRLLKLYRDVPFFTAGVVLLLHLSSMLTAQYGTVFNFGTYSTSGGPSASVSDCASANASSSVGDTNSKLKILLKKIVFFLSKIAIGLLKGRW